MTKKENPILKGVKNFFEKLDQKMLERSKTKPCCSKNKPKDVHDRTCC
ncbi:MAG: hypothetical protein WCX16_06680 [Candidatus Omnitrophota bacterium]